MDLRADVLAGTSGGGLGVGVLGVPVTAVMERARQIRLRGSPGATFHATSLAFGRTSAARSPASGLLDPCPFVRALLDPALAARTTADLRRPTATPVVGLVQLRPAAFVRAPFAHRGSDAGGWW